MPSEKYFGSHEEYLEYYREYRKKHRERLREYNRVYNRKWRAKYGYHNEANSKKRYPEKERCRQMTSYLVRKGIITKKPCRVCRNVLSQAHHEDYGNPYKVIWLCALHHKEHHKKIGTIGK